METVELYLIRDVLAPTHTFGKLSIENDYICETLEDVVRPFGEKVFGQTAIWEGRYELVLDKSARLGIITPHILGVHGFLGIRLHPGNTVADTNGCPLTGRERSGNNVLRSRLAFAILMKRLQAYPDGTKFYINVINRPTA